MKVTEKNNTEEQIIIAAKQVFLEKGFAETSMSDIAAKAGINRPGLHYYFRTKDRMFEAVFADIVYSFIPAIQEIILQDKPISERITEITDVYFSIMQNEPSLPMFVLKEIQRDVTHLLDTVRKLETGQYISKIKEALQTEMDNGNMRQMPIEFMFYTFYGLLFAPFLSKPLIDIVFINPDIDFNEKLDQWKAQVILQMKLLLLL